MSFSDDPASPAAPFSGDGTGQIFDLPDIVAASPTTNERVVDTQSGYLVVVKKLGDRLALSVKRRVGTPPSSSITLSPDESVKLAKILSWSAQEDTGARRRTHERERTASGRRSRNTAEGELPERVVAPSSLSSADIPSRLRSPSLKSFLIPVVVGSAIMLGTGGAVGFFVSNAMHGATPAVVTDASPLSSEKVDHFVRMFVSSMLDFGPETYRASQVQAMSTMTPELMNNYWQETNFPLTTRQLKNLPQGMSILMTELKQEPLADGTVMVDVRAQLTDPKNPKIATPVNLRLKLGLDVEKRIQVLEQQDLSATAK
ncbi:MAG: hypothetical protein K2W95_12985 [Candidatus Obscuribacterales bacterium]|nr:hypothetical protein [Candidatus Obscuribacterales bacterium]